MEKLFYFICFLTPLFAFGSNIAEFDLGNIELTRQATKFQLNGSILKYSENKIEQITVESLPASISTGLNRTGSFIQNVSIDIVAPPNEPTVIPIENHESYLVIKSFFNAIKEQKYDTSWKLLARDHQKQIGGFFVYTTALDRIEENQSISDPEMKKYIDFIKDKMKVFSQESRPSMNNLGVQKVVILFFKQVPLLLKWELGEHSLIFQHYSETTFLGDNNTPLLSPFSSIFTQTRLNFEAGDFIQIYAKNEQKDFLEDEYEGVSYLLSTKVPTLSIQKVQVTSTWKILGYMDKKASEDLFSQENQRPLVLWSRD